MMQYCMFDFSLQRPSFAAETKKRRDDDRAPQNVDNKAQRCRVLHRRLRPRHQRGKVVLLECYLFPEEVEVNSGKEIRCHRPRRQE